MTLKDISLMSGYSIKTVSRVINKESGVNEETRKKINEIIKQNGYTPNLVARSLVTSKTNTIGVMLPNITNPFYPEFIAGIEEAARNKDYAVIFTNATSFQMAVSGINLFLSRKVDGIIVAPMIFEDERKEQNTYLNIMEKFNKYLEDKSAEFQKNISLCLLNPQVSTSNPNMTKIKTNEVYGGYLAMNHLVSLGHRKIAHISDVYNKGIWAERMEGYLSVLKQHNIPFNPEYVIRAEETFAGGHKAMEELLKLKDRPTAIYAANDILALGAVNTALRAGIKVPDEISIIGFDGLNIGTIYYPKLTTVSHNSYYLGSTCFSELFHLMVNKDSESRNIVINPNLVLGETTKRNQNNLL